jgi:hypothetical protein
VAARIGSIVFCAKSPRNRSASYLNFASPIGDLGSARSRCLMRRVVAHLETGTTDLRGSAEAKRLAFLWRGGAGTQRAGAPALRNMLSMKRRDSSSADLKGAGRASAGSSLLAKPMDCTCEEMMSTGLDDWPPSTGPKGCSSSGTCSRARRNMCAGRRGNGTVPFPPLIIAPLWLTSPTTRWSAREAGRPRHAECLRPA